MGGAGAVVAAASEIWGRVLGRGGNSFALTVSLEVVIGSGGHDSASTAPRSAHHLRDRMLGERLGVGELAAAEGVTTSSPTSTVVSRGDFHFG